VRRNTQPGNRRVGKLDSKTGRDGHPRLEETRENGSRGEYSGQRRKVAIQATSPVREPQKLLKEVLSDIPVTVPLRLERQGDLGS
jgi:hypothetical protein